MWYQSFKMESSMGIPTLYPLIEKGSLVGESPKFTIIIIILLLLNVHLHSDNDYLTIIHKRNQRQSQKHSYRHLSSPLMGLVFQFEMFSRV